VADDEQQRKRRAARRATIAFGQVVGLMARSKVHGRVPVAELEWLVAPAIRSGQFLMAGKRVRSRGMVLPVSALLWARVSDDVDKELTETAKPVRLAPKAWTSGDHIWLVEAVGEQKVVPQMIAQLGQTVWKGKTVKVRSRDADGTIVVRTIGPM
jgi:hemolysin-activating ACP:hemolysin acyltransferase